MTSKPYCVRCYAQLRKRRVQEQRHSFSPLLLREWHMNDSLLRILWHPNTVFPITEYALVAQCILSLPSRYYIWNIKIFNQKINKNAINIRSEHCFHKYWKFKFDSKFFNYFLIIIIVYFISNILIQFYATLIVKISSSFKRNFS